MTDMVERVALVIATAMRDSQAIADWDEHAIARAAIAAMREPTDAMELAADLQADHYLDSNSPCDVTWRVMIDAALNHPNRP